MNASSGVNIYTLYFFVRYFEHVRAEQRWSSEIPAISDPIFAKVSIRITPISHTNIKLKYIYVMIGASVQMHGMLLSKMLFRKVVHGIYPKDRNGI
jgi:hypothetical protein